MDDVALSRVSSQLLKGGLGQIHSWTTDGCCCIEQGVWPVIEGGLGQIHSWTTDGCCCIEQGV